MAKKRTPSPAPSFEESLARLELTVRNLEEGDLGLSEALEKYEEGVRQLKLCYQTLAEAERRIELLAGLDGKGEPRTEPFDEQQMTLEEKQKRRTARRSHPAPQRSGGDDVDASGTLF